MDENKDIEIQESKWKKGFKITGLVIDYIFVFLAVLVSLSIFWMFRTWAGLNINELMFTIRSSTEGTDKAIIYSYIVSCLLVALLITVALILLYKFLKKGKRAVLACSTVISFAIAATSVYYMWSRLNISAYAENVVTYSSFMDEHYVDPTSVDIVFPAEKRNLIYIFMESMENTYASTEVGGSYEVNYIPELTELSNDNENFSGDKTTLDGGIVLNGTTWTVAGIVGQTAGIPLMIPIDENAMNTQNEFLPGLVTLGDILQAEGYNQTFLLGSDMNFGGRAVYFSQHGNYNIKDYHYSKSIGQIPEDYAVFWGYEDVKLFDFAKDELTNLSSQIEPFNLTMLTVDTHFEDGYICEECGSIYGDDQYANVIACSSKHVSEFVEWIQQQDFYKNTTIVISGDHLTMDSDFCSDVPEDYQRTVYTTYINSPIEPESTEYRRYSTFDNFPTTIAALGATIEGDRLGLGTNLFSSSPTLIEQVDIETINTEMEKKSDLMDRLTFGIDVEYAKSKVEEQTKTIELNTIAEVEVTDYDYRKGYFEVIVRNINNVDYLQNVQCAVWAEEDQSDLMWYNAELQEDGSYMCKVWARDFYFKECTYQVHVYGIIDTGAIVNIKITEGTI